jgi:hypothetical protein
MYDTTFKVQYWNIEHELTQKLLSLETEAGAEHCCEYSAEDIEIVCDKLYRDELTSVFNAEDILDDKIDEGMRTIMSTMRENTDFDSLVVELTNTIIKEKELINEDDVDSETRSLFAETMDTIVRLTFFSKPLFYLTHRCICNQLNDTIDIDLLQQLRTEAMLLAKQ